MKTGRSLALLIALACAMPLSGLCAQAGAVMPAQRRLDALKSAGELLAPRKSNWEAIAADLPDPFFRKNFVPVAREEPQPGERPGRKSEQSDSELLKAIAPDIAPTGTMLIGAEPYLLVSGRRFRVGDQISVTFDGMVYQVAISSIERNSYTLQLNQTELRREFK